MLRSTFSVLLVLAEETGPNAPDIVKLHTFLAITDHDDGMSVTNDIENVLSTLQGAGDLHADMKVIYRDTEGVWDQVIINERCEFVTFRSINERDRDAAISKVIMRLPR